MVEVFKRVPFSCFVPLVPFMHHRLPSLPSPHLFLILIEIAASSPPFGAPFVGLDGFSMHFLASISINSKLVFNYFLNHSVIWREIFGLLCETERIFSPIVIAFLGFLVEIFHLQLPPIRPKYLVKRQSYSDLLIVP